MTRIPKATVAVAIITVLVAFITTLAFGHATAQAQRDQGAVQNLRLSSDAPGDLNNTSDIPSPAPTDYGRTWADQRPQKLSDPDGTVAGTVSQWFSSDTPGGNTFAHQDPPTWTTIPDTGTAIDGKFYKHIAGTNFLMVWDSADETGTRLHTYEAHSSACGDNPDADWEQASEHSQVTFEHTAPTGGAFKIRYKRGDIVGEERNYPPTTEAKRWQFPPTTTTCTRANVHDKSRVWNNNNIVYIKNRRTIILEAHTIANYGTTTATHTRAPQLDIPLKVLHAFNPHTGIGSGPSSDQPETIYAIGHDGRFHLYPYDINTQQPSTTLQRLEPNIGTGLWDFHFIPTDAGGTAYYTKSSGVFKQTYTKTDTGYNFATEVKIEVTQDGSEASPVTITGSSGLLFAAAFDTARINTLDTDTDTQILTQFNRPGIDNAFLLAGPGEEKCAIATPTACHFAVSTTDGLVLYITNTFGSILYVLSELVNTNRTDFEMPENAEPGSTLEGFFTIQSTYVPNPWVFEDTDEDSKHNECFTRETLGSLEQTVRIKVADPLPAHCKFDFESTQRIYKVTAPITWPIESSDELTYDIPITITVTNVNEPSPDLPTITGGKREDDTITADTSGISDPDGGNLTSWRYKWLRSRTSDRLTFATISGATSKTYKLVGADAGQDIRVKVTYEESNFGRSSELESISHGQILRNYDPAIVFNPRTFPENSDSTPDFQATFSDQNSEDRSSITAELGGTHGSVFTITNTGELDFKTPPDYEHNEPSTGNKIYNISIKVRSGTGPQQRTITKGYAIAVSDVDEPPLVPTAITFSDTKQQSLGVAWTAPDNTGRPPITKYQVQYRDHSTDDWADNATDTIVDGNTAAKYDFTGLTRNNHYDFRVRAVNDEGTGPWSTAADKSTLANKPPELEATYTASVMENTSVGHTIVTITATDDDFSDGGSWAFTKYGTDHDKFTLENTDGSAYIKVKTKLNFEDFPADDNTLSFTLKVEDGQTGSDTATVTITVTDVDEAPDKPAVPRVTAGSDDRSLDITWSAPANQGPPITSYKLQYRSRTSGAFTAISTAFDASTFTYTHIKLLAGTQYQYQVSATNAEGTSSWSDVGSGTTTANTRPTFGSSNITYDIPEDIGTTAGTVRTVGTITATDADGGTITYSLHGGDSSKFTIDASNGQIQTEAQRFDFEAKSSYSFTARASDSHTGEPPKTADVTITVNIQDQPEPPLVPTNVATNNITRSSYNLSWTAPSNTGRPVITKYVVEWTNNTSSGTITSKGVTSTSASITGLSHDTTYYTRVFATNHEGNSPKSAWITVETLANNAPSFPTGSGTRSLNENSTIGATVGSPVRATDQDADTVVHSIQGSNAGGFTVDGSSGQIKAGNVGYNYEVTTSYTITVRATDEHGASTDQQVVISIADLTEVPGRVDKPSSTAQTLTSLKFTWTKPTNTGPVISKYQYEYRKGSGSWTTVTDTTATTVTLTGLDRNSAYSFRVRAVNDEGTGAYSLIATSRTNDYPQVSVSFENATYTVAEGSNTAIKVVLSADPKRSVTIPISKTNLGGATNTDYSVPANVTFASGETEKTITFTATDNTADDDGDSVRLGFGTLPARIIAGTTNQATVNITDDDDPAVTVRFELASYTIAEQDDLTTTSVAENQASIKLILSADPERTVAIPLTPTNQGGATPADYSALPASITFNTGETEKSFTLTATNDTVDDDGESLKLAFGTMPTLVSGGTTQEAVVSITDDDKPASLTVAFGSTAYTVAEGGNATIKVTLSDDPEMDLTIPISTTTSGGASSGDYSIAPNSLTFEAGDTEQELTFTATDDTVDDDEEKVTLTFGTLPTTPISITAGSISTAVVSITDDDHPEVTVSFKNATYAVAEGSSTAIKVKLNADPERTVDIPISTSHQGGTTSGDYSGVPANVTFNAGETEKTITFMAEQDTVDDDDESVTLTFGTIPTRVSEGTTNETVVSITDDDKPTSVDVNFGAANHAAAEGSTAKIKITLSDDPERTVVVNLTPTNQNGASNDDYTVDTSITFNAGDTEQELDFTATDDTLDDDGETVKLTFGTITSIGRAGTTDETTVAITDNDDPQVTVSFGAAAYTVAENASETITVTLSADPERTVAIPLTKTNQGGASSADYSGVPTSVTFNTGETSKTFAFAATDDNVDDDGESVKLGFGAPPERITMGSTSESVVSITDDDKPTTLTVKFEQLAYTVAEGSSVAVKITLSDDPEQNIVIAITSANQGGASSADYDPIPTSMTFKAGETSRSFTFTAVDDSADDDNESVKFTFGTLPTTPAVTAIAPNETVVSINDNNVPEVTVNYQNAAHTVAEGSSVTIRVTLSADPERTLTIPISRSNENGASDQDYSAVPASVTITSGNTSETFTVSMTQDTLDDDGESVRLGFGAMPTRVTQGTTNESVINITDDDDPQVSVSFEQAGYSVDEGKNIAIKVVLSADPERSVTIPLTKANQNGATSADYSGVPASMTFDSGDTEHTFTFTADDDTEDDDGESLKLGFGTLPTQVSAGTNNEATVNITDDDDPAVTVSFGTAAYTVAEGATVTLTVTLNADPERTVVIPLTTTNQDGATSADYSGVPASVTFDSGETSKSFEFTAEQDTDDDDGESVKLTFGTLQPQVTAGTTAETTANITDDDDPTVTVEFDSDTYTVAEGDATPITISLSTDPKRTIAIPLLKTDQGGASDQDYSGVPASVTFNAGETSKTFDFTATDDTVDDNSESVRLTFGTLPPQVSEGATDETTVNITDNDDPTVTVSFVQDAYLVVEGGTVTIRIILSADPERTVVIPISKTEQNGASSADYSGIPASVTFNSGETYKTFDFAATEDSLSDTSESVKLGFGTMPPQVSEGSPSETTITISQTSGQFQLDCNQAVWCADLHLDDYTAVDWGWSQLQYNASFSPPANLSVKTFTFQGVEYTIRAVYVVPGIYPEIDNAYNRVQRSQGEFQIAISHGKTWEAVPEEHYQNWELHVGGVVLPFGEGALWEKRWFLWYGLEFQEIFTDWTSSTVNKIGIREIPSVQHLPTVPPAPAYVSAAAQDSDGLRVSWHSPWTRQRNQAITGYIVQWKQASHSWSDSAQVSSMEVDPKSISAQVNGLTEGVLYTVRVIATNAVGDGPPSEDAIGKPQSSSPHLVSATVDGQTLTLRYNRPLDTNSVPAKSAFMVITGLGLREVNSVSILGMEITLNLAKAVTSVYKVQAGYVAPADASASFLRDTEGNHVYALGGDLPSVTNETDPALLQPLTAQFTNVPTTHDGGDSFSFNIEFSESVWIDVGLGKDNLLQVAGGTVTAAHWLDRRTEEWEVTIQPSSDADVVVVLPGGRICSVKGAPCATGNRVLSGRETVTISGHTSQQQAANNPATGTPSINGTAQIGQTLTATTTDISDADGLVNVTFIYQWLADDTDISGATGSSYTVTDGDVDKTIRVRVSFTDDAGNAETLISTATIAVTLTALQLQAAAVDGTALTLTYNNDIDVGVTLPASAFTVKVAANGRPISNVSVTGRTVELTLASAVEAGETVTVSYDKPNGSSFIRDTQGNTAGSFSHETAINNTVDSTDTSQRSDTSEQEAQVPGAPANLRAATGNSGELSLSWHTPSSDGGSEITGYKVRWKASSGSWDTPADVSETTITGTAHTITGLTDGTGYDVQVRAINAEGVGEASSQATATPVNPTPLMVTTHDVAESHDGNTAFTFELRFSENIESLSYTTLQEHALTVTGGTLPKVRRLEPGQNVRWEMTVTPDSDAEVTIAVNATTDCTAEGAICTSDSRMLSSVLEMVVPGPPSNSVATGAPTIGGTAQVDETLTATTSDISDDDGMTNATFTYQWLADDDEISGATGSSYTLADADASKAIKVQVSFTDDVGNAESLTSAATAAVARPPLTATVHDNPSSHDGSNTFTFEIRFSENIDGLSYTTLQNHALTVTGGTLPKARRLEAGQNVRWEITVQPSSDAGVTIVLPITTDCTTQGAICTRDGRTLSNRLEITVSGTSE